MTDRKSMINDLTSGPMTRQILLFSVPLVLGNLLHTLYNLVDLAIVGQVVGSVGLSAVSTAGQITMLLYTLGIGLGNGAQILISQQVGAGDRAGVKKTLGTTIVFTIMLGVAVAALGITFNRLLLRLMNTPAEAWQDAVEYMAWCCLGVPFTYCLGSLCALLRGMGESKQPMFFIGVSAAANVALDILLVAVFGMRAKGAAIATASAQLLGCAYAFIYLYRRRESFGFDFRRESFRMDKKTLITVLKLSAPLAFQSMAINISMLFVSGWVNAYGVVASAVTGVGNKLYSLMSIFTNAMATAEATFTGQNIAAGKLSRVRRSMLITTAFAMAFWVLVSSLCLIFPKAVFGVFTGDAQVLAMAPDYMHITIWMYLTFALLSEPMGLINGIGHVVLNLAIAIADGVVARICLCLLLTRVFDMGVYGYWWGSALAGMVTVVWGWAYFFFGKWDKRKLLTHS